MPKYKVQLVASAGHSVDVEAGTEDEAIEAALTGALPFSCHQCPQIDEWEFMPDIDNRVNREDFITKLEEVTE